MRGKRKMTDLDKAKELLLSENLTCAVVRGSSTWTSTARGVKPLLDWLDSGEDLVAACAADKVVGKGAAMLYVLLGVKSVYAAVISTPALDCLRTNGITVTAGETVPRILNRTGDGFCPIESAVCGIDDPAEALSAIRKRLAELKSVPQD